MGTWIFGSKLECVGKPGTPRGCRKRVVIQSGRKQHGFMSRTAVVMKYIMVPRDDNFHQRSVIHKVCSNKQ